MKPLPIPLEKETQDLWASELASLNRSILLIESEARAYLNMANSCRDYAPELVQEYIDWAVWASKRAEAARERRQKIQDYLAGKINQWW